MNKNRILFALLLILPLSSCIHINTLAMNQTFKDGDFLISQGQKFTLGFFSPGSSSYRYLGIWFRDVPLQTVVWVANRNNPIIVSSGNPGILSINQQEGNLILYSDNNPVWSTNVSMEVNDILEARLLDTGNLVLVSRSKGILWQSFEHPTNTMLPGMNLGLNKKTGLNSQLSSWRSTNDPGTGNYSYRLNPRGSPQFLLHNGIKHYWRSHPWPWKRISFPDISYYDFINNGESIHHNYSVTHPSFTTRIQLDESGYIRGLIWHERDSDWKQYLILPSDRCDFHGRCGAYGKCDAYNINRFDCTCLPGYEPKFPRDWNLRDERGGCVRKRLDSSSVCGNGEGFVKVESVKLPDTTSAVWIDMTMSRNDCELECMRNCSCSAYSSIDIDGRTSCLAWYGDLVDTKINMPDIGYDLYVRVDAIELDENVRRPNRMNRTSLIISVSLAWTVIITIIFFLLKYKKKKWIRKKKKKRRIYDPRTRSDNLEHAFSASNEFEGGSSSHSDVVFFDLNTILAATDNFSSDNKIGQGGFGSVYKGQLSNGKEIAVKRMSISSRQGIEEFKNEVRLISKLQHKNLVKLLGCCNERNEQILIYEYLPNKSLDSFLFDEKRRKLMDWGKRFDIVVGIARGILYLHQDSRLTIIHRDLKCSNILLDARMNPKISDFGMAKIFFGDQTQGMTKRVVGTYGYMSPEYAMFGKYSVKSDVFSFGVILLEVISGMKSINFCQNDPSLTLAGHVWELWNESRALEIVDPSLTESCNPVEALRGIQVGLLCVQEDAKERPTMLDVILMLKSETPIPSPKQPAFIFKASSSNTKPPGLEECTCSINEVTMSAILTR